MALPPTCKAKKQSDAPWTQETEDKENVYLGWFWECIGLKKSSEDRLERRPSSLNRIHNGEGGYAATRQGEGPRDLSTLSQEATKTTALGLHVTNKPKVLSILSCKAGGFVQAFVQSEEQGTTKQWPQSYSLAEYCELSDALPVLEEFQQNFSQWCCKYR
ncbi:hypothetical protein EJ07DRAFT_132757 [Lizonia empirigonia]|nr:hypothetical protein EJ07DRAFT_132757 [Lizonia empirigonia]